MKYANFSSTSMSILRNSILINGKQKFLDPWIILDLKFEDLDLVKDYLLSVDEIYTHFMTVYGK